MYFFLLASGICVPCELRKTSRHLWERIRGLVEGRYNAYKYSEVSQRSSGYGTINDTEMTVLIH